MKKFVACALASLTLAGALAVPAAARHRTGCYTWTCQDRPN